MKKLTKEQQRRVQHELVKAHNNGFMSGACCILVGVGKDNDEPTIARNVAAGFGIADISFFTGHGIDPTELKKLRRILK